MNSADDLTTRPLDVRLVLASKGFSSRAFDCHENSDWEGFIVHAATAVELLAKAVLARVNPLLIADPRSDLSVVALSRGGHRPLSVEIRTIGAEKALDLARKLGVHFDRFGDDLETVRKARNSLVHLGQFDVDVLEKGVDAWIRTMVALAEHGEWSSSLVFGKHTEFVETQLKQFVDETQRLLTQRLGAAEARWAIKRNSFDDYALDQVRLALVEEHRVGNIENDDPEVQWAACPVCSLPADLYGELIPVAEYDSEEGQAYVSGVSYEFEPSALRCRTCGLNLDNGDLVGASGALASWELGDEDYDRWLDNLAGDLASDLLL